MKKETESQKRYMSQKEFAEYMDVGPPAISSQVKKGNLILVEHPETGKKVIDTASETSLAYMRKHNIRNGNKYDVRLAKKAINVSMGDDIQIGNRVVLDENESGDDVASIFMTASELNRLSPDGKEFLKQRALIAMEWQRVKVQEKQIKNDKELDKLVPRELVDKFIDSVTGSIASFKQFGEIMAPIICSVCETDDPAKKLAIKKELDKGISNYMKLVLTKASEFPTILA